MSATSESIFVLGIDPGVPREKAAAASAVLRLDPAGVIGLVEKPEALSKPALAAFLRKDPLLADERLRTVALNAPLTFARLERKPWRARLVEIRLARGAFSGSMRGPQPPWISAARSGWLRYQEAAPLQDLLRDRGFPLFLMPSEDVETELPERCCVEVYPKATLAVLMPRAPLKDRPVASKFMGQIDDWLFPQIFLPPSPETPAPIETILETLAPGLRLAPETLQEAERITRIRRPFSRREPLRAFVAALQGILAHAGAAALVGAAGDTEGSYLLPATWQTDWENEWKDPRNQELGVRRVHIP